MFYVILSWQTSACRLSGIQRNYELLTFADAKSLLSKCSLQIAFEMRNAPRIVNKLICVTVQREA